ncbi:MAG: CapA family protein [Oscillospiraceae bacterium]|nr:CapA family protein [Oscillospiraceae bacterium]
MSEHTYPPRRRKKQRSPLKGLVFFMALLLAGLIVIAAMMGGNGSDQLPSYVGTVGAPEETTQETTIPTEPPIVKEATFTLSATGDILIHAPVFKSCAVSGGGYNFDPIFTYFKDYVSKADYAIGNLETTLAGSNNGYKYNGYPRFNCPDEVVDGVKNAGFDMLLTANNHAYDTSTTGLNRTVKVVREKGLDNLGTKADKNEPNFFVVERGGIKLGLACYTYETNQSADKKAPNGLPMKTADAPLMNTFDYGNLDLLYKEVQESKAQMDDQGVNAMILFIHWGNEYQTKQNSRQSEIAQKLCDLGVDVIIGGHPHVVQPVDLLTSTTDENHKTVCLYSMGNAVSNQRIKNMNLKTGHTEDGVLFSVTFARYTDGTVILESADLLPTWVHLSKHPETGKDAYMILPLDDQVEDWQATLPLSDSALKKAKESYDRTTKIVGAGMTKVNDYLTQRQADTEVAIGVTNN